MEQQSSRINISIPRKPAKIILIVLLIVVGLYLVYQCVFGVSYFFRYAVFASAKDSSVTILQEDIDKVTNVLSENSIKFKMATSGQVICNGEEVIAIFVLKRQFDKLQSLNLSFDDEIWTTSFRGDYPIFRWWY